MINIAVVEDEDVYADKLQEYLEKYEAESNNSFSITHFSDGYHIIDNYKAEYDVILMDVKMQNMNGMTAAKKIRKKDAEVVIIFITKTPQYAIQGYAVDALDYVLKPVSYFALTQRLERAINRIRNRNDKFVTIIFKGGAKKININDIYYIEIANHTLTYHTRDGEYSATGTMKSIENELKDEGFFRCNRCYLVNLNYVDKIEGKFAVVNGEKLLISRSRKSDFLEALTDQMRKVIK